MKEFFIHRYRSETNQADPRRTLIRVDDAGLITYADTQAEAILGYDSEALVGSHLSRLTAAGQDDPLSPGHRHRLESGQTVILTLRHSEGFFFTAQLSLRVEIRDSDQAASAYISLRGNTPLDPRLIHLTESSGQLGIWELDILDNQVTWTDGVYHILELKPGAEISPEQAMFYCQNDQHRLRALIRRCIRSGQPFRIDLSVLTARQHLREVRMTGRALKSGHRIVRIGGSLVDRSETQRVDNARAEAEQMLQAVIGATDDLVAAVDRDLNLLYFNQAFSKQVRLTFNVDPSPGDNMGELLQQFPNERRLMQRLWARAFERNNFVVEMPLAQQNRELPVYEVHYQKLLDRQGELLGAVHVARDITQRVGLEGNRNYLSRHDPITGLLNRREFITRLERVVSNNQNTPGAHGLLYLDLDNFADFSDQAGSGACDRYLRELAGVLGMKVRQRDALARLSGDTFALLIENCNEHKARKVAGGILEHIAAFTFDWQGHSLQTTASAGLLLLNEASPENPELLLTRASDLCHTAKTAGRNRVHTASVQGDSMKEGEARDRLEQLQKCLDQDRLTLEFQSLRPVASVTWGDHIEILARIRTGDSGTPLMQPAEFLPIAQRFDLAKDIDRRVIRKTITWLGQHRLLEPRLKYCGFNLSLASLMDDTFPDFVQALLQNSAYAPSCFCFEVQESDATQYPDDVSILCDALHRIGCRVALDGAGASVQSYSLAATLPVDIIKLDQSMMKHLHDDPVQQVMVEALHKIAEAAGKITVATFIENDDALRKVRGLGIHYGQGFRLSQPKPLSDLAPAVVELDTGRIGGRNDPDRTPL